MSRLSATTFLFSDWRGDHDVSWARNYYERLGRELHAVLPKPLAESSGVIQKFQEEAVNAYGHREIQPYAFSTARYLVEQLRLIAESNTNLNLIRNVLQECCIAFVRAAGSPSENVHNQVRDGVLLHARYRQFEPVWKVLFTFCFREFQPARQRCIFESRSLDEWRSRIIDLYPLLLLVDVAPTYEIEYGDKFKGEESTPEAFARAPYVISNVTKTPSPLFKKSVTDPELQILLEEQKVIDETVANVHRAALLIDNDVPNFLHAKRQEMRQIAAKDGYIPAREYIIIEQTLRMSIPTFFAEELKQELSANARH